MKANRHIQYKALRLAALTRFIKAKYIGKTALVLITPLVVLNLWTVIDGKTNIPKGSNVILISIDTLRADHLGCYGYEKNTTPNIDEFSKNAFLFENAYSPAPLTTLALRSIMTGRLISNDNKNDIISYYNDATFLAEILSERGYLTVGFVDHRGLGHHRLTLSKGFNSFHNFAKDHMSVTSHILTENVINWLERNHKNKFFLWVHYFDPHFNYNPLPEYEELFGFSKEDCGRIYNGIDIEKIRKIEHDLTKKEVECLISLYDAEIFYTDKYIGKLLGKIKDLNLETNTVIIITADHGEEFRERTRIGHEMTLYNELIHVPLIIKMPNQAPAKIKENISTKEIFNILSNLDSNKSIKFDENIISRTYHYYKNHRTEPNDFTIISKNYKYIYNPKTKKEEFYNLQEDIEEKNNLIMNAGSADKKQELKQELISWINKNDIKVKEPTKKALENEKELNLKLRSLGYLQ